jgi:hypothetical protein
MKPRESSRFIYFWRARRSHKNQEILFYFVGKLREAIEISFRILKIVLFTVFGKSEI